MMNAIIRQLSTYVNVVYYCAYMAQTKRSATRAVADRMRELRDRYGWSAKQLAEEMTAVGLQWDRTVVANLENGRRGGVTVEELLALGYVLDVPPLTLITSPGDTDSVSVLPDLDMGPYALWAWMHGDVRPDRITADTPARMNRWAAATQPLKLVESYREAHRALDRADRRVRRAEHVGKAEEIADARGEHADALTAWAEVVEKMTRQGMRVPAYPPRWRSEAQELGLIEGDADAGR